MTTRTSTVSPLASLSTSPRPPAPRGSTGRAAAWVVALVWGLPLLGFTAAALLAPPAVVLALAATGCAVAGGGVLILVANLLT